MINKIQNIIKQEEGLSVEFKLAKNELPNSLFETVVAFLNKSGGTILLGIGDDKEIQGVDENVADELCKQIANLGGGINKSFNLGRQLVVFI